MSQHALVHLAIPAIDPVAAGTCSADLFDRMDA